MSEEPLVSIILPVYNGAKYLREAIESALAQTYHSIELIAVDDGSTDTSAEILTSYQGKIRYFRQENRGAAAARNRGIREARGQYLAFLDADDIWSSQKLRRQVAYLRKHPAVKLVCNRWKEWNEDEPCPSLDEGGGEAERPYLPHSGWIYNELLLDCIVHTTTVVMDSSMVAQIGLFDETLLRGQDYDYWLRASRVTTIDTLDATLSVYRLHAASSIQRPMEQNFPSLVLEHALQRWGRTGPDGRTTPLFRMRRRMAREWYTFGNMHWRAGNRRRAAHAFMRCISAWPLHVRSWISLVASGLLSLSAEQNA